VSLGTNTSAYAERAYEARSRREEESRLDLRTVALPTFANVFMIQDTSIGYGVRIGITQDLETVSWGLIGCGHIAQKRVGPALRDLPASNLIAVNRDRYGLLEGFVAKFGAKRLYRSWKDLLADEEIDAVYLATPVDLHAPITIAAAEKGKHVLCEKPMALDVEQCDDRIRTCQEHGVGLGIAYYRHF